MLTLVEKLILASGTLEPAGDFQLIAGGKHHKFSCSHVIKPCQFKAVLAPGLFTYNERDNMLEQMRLTIEWALKEQSSKIGGGIIVFVQSYVM